MYCTIHVYNYQVFNKNLLKKALAKSTGSNSVIKPGK